LSYGLDRGLAVEISRIDKFKDFGFVFVVKSVGLVRRIFGELQVLLEVASSLLLGFWG